MPPNDALIKVNVAIQKAVASVESLGGKFDRIQKTLGQLSSRVYPLKIDTSRAEKGLESITNSVGEFKDAVTAGFERLSGEAIQRAVAAIDTLISRIDRLISLIERVSSKPISIRADTQKIDSEISKITDEIAKLREVSAKGFSAISDDAIQKAVGSIDILNDRLEKLQETFDKVTQKPASVKVSTRNARSEVNSLTASVFKFRDSVAVSFATLNNLLFRTFRRLARIRTGFFILVTFLGVRPLIRFFRSFVDQSAEGIRALRRVREEADIVFTRLSKAIAPLVEKFSKSILRFIKNAFVGVLSSEAFVNKVGELIFRLQKILSAVANAFLASAKLIEGAFIAIDLAVRKLTGSSSLQLLLKIATAGVKGFTQLLRIADAVGETLGVISATNPFDKAQRDIANKLIDDVKNNLLKELREVEKDYKGFFEEINNLAAEPIEIAQRQALRRLKENREEFNRLTGEITAALAQVFRPGTQIPDDWRKVFETVRNIAIEVFSDPDPATEASENLIAGISQGIEAQIQTTKKIGENFGKAISEGFETGLSDSVLAVMEFRFKRLKDVAVSALRAIQKALADLVAQQIFAKYLGVGLNSLTGAISSLFTPTAGTQTTTQSQFGRFAIGPTLTKVGEKRPELIIPAEDLKQLGSSGSVAVTFNVNAIDAAGVANFLQRSQRGIENIITRAVSGRNSDLRNAIKAI